MAAVEGLGGVWLAEWLDTVFYYLHVLHFNIQYMKFSVCDTLRHSLSHLFNHCCVSAHHICKMPSRRMRKDAKTKKRLRLPSSAKIVTLKKEKN